MENLKILKENSDHGDSHVNDFWKEGCITLSRKVDSNHTPSYYIWISFKLGWDYIFQYGYSVDQSEKGTQILHGFISFRCNVCK